MARHPTAERQNCVWRTSWRKGNVAARWKIASKCYGWDSRRTRTTNRANGRRSLEVWGYLKPGVCPNANQHVLAIDYISQLEKTVNQFQQETTHLRSELDDLRAKVEQQQRGQQPMQQPLYDHHPPPTASTVQQNSQPQQPQQAPVFSNRYPSGPVGPPQQDQGRTLPPLMNGALAPMQGVQYTEENR